MSYLLGLTFARNEEPVRVFGPETPPHKKDRKTFVLLKEKNVKSVKPHWDFKQRVHTNPPVLKPTLLRRRLRAASLYSSR